MRFHFQSSFLGCRKKKREGKLGRCALSESRRGTEGGEEGGLKTRVPRTPSPPPECVKFFESGKWGERKGRGLVLLRCRFPQSVLGGLLGRGGGGGGGWVWPSHPVERVGYDFFSPLSTFFLLTSYSKGGMKLSITFSHASSLHPPCKVYKIGEKKKEEGRKKKEGEGRD